MKKDVLVIGGGGREHAICQKLKESSRVGTIYAAPGNAGIAQIAECVDIKATDLDGILDFVRANPDIYMTVVAPDDPLSMGLVDRLNAGGFRAFGPDKAAARIESSKAFSKNLMKKYGIDTAAFEVFEDYSAAKSYLDKASYPLVIKTDGLALGKGVLICENLQQASDGLKSIMLDKAFGVAGSRIVVEEFLRGVEVSLLAFTDGKTVKLMPSARDYKRAFDGDNGLNTGGMGAFSPVPDFMPYIKKAEKEIVIPTVKAMQQEGCPFSGVLYFGLMVCADGIKVLEYNARFGDPETQVVLPALTSDLLDVFDAVIDGRLDTAAVEWDGKKRVCVVAASGGYPLEYKKGDEIFLGGMPEGVQIFHAGTTFKDYRMVTNGGRVLAVSASGDTLAEAREKAYKGVSKVIFGGMFYRKDIAAEV
ncbi:phosphoribosylamine--glycine ligase [Holotrichia oblita]|nr:phosphoribosylamine--glycine ligase [Holotrichia oblita]